MNFHDPDQEQAVLSYAVKTNESCAEVCALVKADLFDDLRHQKIWETIRFYFAQYSGVLTKGSLQTILTQHEVPHDKQVMYLSVFDQVSGRMATQDQFKIALDVLKDLRFKRGLFDLINRTATQLERQDLDKDQICNGIVSSIMSLQMTQDSEVSELLFKEEFGKIVDDYVDRRDHPEKYVGFLYGIKKLDVLTGGVRPGELSIVSGRPGAGKSEFIHNIAYYNAQLGKNSLLVTIEMPKAQEGRRLASRHLQISSTGLRHAALSSSEEKKFLNASKDMSSVPGEIILVDMPQGCSASQLLPLIRKHRMKRPIDAVLIDYLNLMEPSRWSNSLVERTGTIVRELKQLARLEGIPVITPTRATRDSIKKKDEDLGTEDLSWSDSIGYDADQILYLRKDKELGPLTSTIELTVLKYRDGANEKIQIGADFDKSFMGDLEDLLRGQMSKLL